MDLSTAVRTDTLPAIGTILAPGLVASAPYSWLWLGQSPDIRAFLGEHEAIALTAAVLLWTVNGFAIDSLGSYVEVHLIDRRRPDHAVMLATWWKYLRIAWVREPVGQHYLRRMLVSFKFELNMFVAALASLLGIFVLGVTGTSRWQSVVVAGIGLGALAVLLAKAARDSSDVLADIRAALVQGVGEPPFDASGHPTPTRSA